MTEGTFLEAPCEGIFGSQGPVVKGTRMAAIRVAFFSSSLLFFFNLLPMAPHERTAQPAFSGRVMMGTVKNCIVKKVYIDMIKHISS